MADKKSKQKADYDEESWKSDRRCFMKQFDGCNGYVIRLPIGVDNIDVCIGHAVLLKKILDEWGF